MCWYNIVSVGGFRFSGCWGNWLFVCYWFLCGVFAVGAALVMVLGYSMCFYTWVLLSVIDVVGGYFGVWLCGFWVLLGFDYLVVWFLGVVVCV